MLFIGIGRVCIVVPKFQYNLFVGLLDIRILTVQVDGNFDLHRFLYFLEGNRMIASKLKLGDEMRVVLPSRSLSEVWHDVHHRAVDFWQNEGFKLTYSAHSSELDKYHSSR